MYSLPKTLTVKGIEHPIRTDFRDILKVIVAFDDPELDGKEKVYVALRIVYEDFDYIDADDYEDALKEALKFIGMGKEANSKKQTRRAVDFEQDEFLIMPAVNKVAGKDVRDMKYLHWWTFMGYYMEMGECLYSQVLNIRMKKSKGKKLEKYEEEFYKENKDMVDLKEKLTQEEIDEKEALIKML